MLTGNCWPDGYLHTRQRPQSVKPTNSAPLTDRQYGLRLGLMKNPGRPRARDGGCIPYARRGKTRRALWEYDNIIKSLYLLDYVDSPPLRKNVQRALNRGESYHQLRRAVAYANFGKLRFKTEHEQQIWGECSRLITNCIIFYNAMLLSRLLQHAESKGDEEALATLKKVSPVAWRHINFYGRYEFRRQPNAINLDEVIEKLLERSLQREASWP